jgi:hypothetical protein
MHVLIEACGGATPPSRTSLISSSHIGGIMPCFALLLQVYSVCGHDYRLYSSPLIKFQKACYQLVAGSKWFLSGECASPSISVHLEAACTWP